MGLGATGAGCQDPAGPVGGRVDGKSTSNSARGIQAIFSFKVWLTGNVEPQRLRAVPSQGSDHIVPISVSTV